MPLLQTVYQADAAHMNFGKYTLYPCYGITANCNASLVALAIVFGNEDKEGWVKFWEFAKSVHPYLNMPKTTIITDRDKGSIEAMEGVLPRAVNFCSFHRRKNMQTYVKEEKGKYFCLWFYQLLLTPKNHDTITSKHRFEHSAHLDDKALCYLNLVPDHQQYPAARCEMGDGIYMYQRSLQSIAESMNKANMVVRERTAVDPVNTAVMLLQLETKRYKENKAKAWDWNEILTPHGKKLSEEACNPINHCEYKIHINDNPHGNEVSYRVSRLAIGQQYQQYQCYYQTLEEEGSVFEGCSCGLPKTHGIPYHHMVALVKSCCIEGLTQVNAMPFWWMTAHWHKKCPQETQELSEINIKSLRTESKDHTFRYYPPYTAPSKSGWPKKNKHQKSSLEVASEEDAKKKEQQQSNDDKIDNKKTLKKKRGHDSVVGEKGNEGGIVKNKLRKLKSGYKRKKHH